MVETVIGTDRKRMRSRSAGGESVANRARLAIRSIAAGRHVRSAAITPTARRTYAALALLSPTEQERPSAVDLERLAAITGDSTAATFSAAFVSLERTFRHRAHAKKPASVGSQTAG